MPVLGQVPPVNNQEVILTNGTAYLRTKLIALDQKCAMIQKAAACKPGLYRVFPLFPERDGLFELQGEIFEAEAETLKLIL